MIVTAPPNEDRFEELVAQVEYQGGDGATSLCKPHYFQAGAREVQPFSDEATKYGRRPLGLAEPKMYQGHTCSCGNPTRLTIGYHAADGKKNTYEACAVCDSVHLQPRFN